MLVLLLLLVCCTSNVTNQLPGENVSRTPQEVLKNNQEDVNSIKDTKGLIVLSDQYGKNDFIRFYNQDGSLWYEFTFYYDDSDGKFEYKNENFAPFSFHQDYFVLALKCIGKDNIRYEVVVNEETGLKKYVRANDSGLKFVTWEEHILKVFAVGFNQKENPLRETPDGQVKNVDLQKEATFHPVEIKGEWLKVRWNITNQTSNKEAKVAFGWIKWKTGEHMLIELFYFS